MSSLPGSKSDAEDLDALISANHILHYHHVLDAYGHISLRHPENHDVFIMSGDRAPALVSSHSDLIEYNISDSSPVHPASKKGYQERFIHSEIYKRFPEVNSVIHSHSQAVLPYTMSGVAMKPTFHIAGFLGTHVPIYDIVPLYSEDDQQDMLVNSVEFGSSLASAFSTSKSPAPEHNVVLMANHGFTTLGTSIKQAVYRAVYTHVNASVQTNAIMLRNAATGAGVGVEGEMRYLNAEQVKGSLKMNAASQDRPWGLWVEEVRARGLYKHEGRP
ncbi:arad-like aldolase/epimerase [Stipitochalara longipes BDJ]|nr:arad-like aldolase/epimerase [Stipitochalara longipes BDJ]